MEVSASKKPKSRTACDRCYELKERCERTLPSAQCVRCDRLDLVCSTVRPLRVGGRRAHRTESVTRTTSSRCGKQQQYQSSIDSYLNKLPNLQPEEKELLMFLLSQSEGLNQFVACPSFQAGQQQLILDQLPAALPLLKDALLAYAVAVKQLQAGTAIEPDTTSSVHYILKAMGALRSLPVISSQDADLCNALGGLLAFSISSAIGVGVPDICRHCLGTTTPYLLAEPDTHEDPWKSFLILLDTMDCLVHRQMPTLRMRVSASNFVDPRLGLCLPLLPYYYDLGVISNSLLNTTDMIAMTRLHKQLDEIHQTVEPWQPSHLEQLVGQFDSTEIVHLLAQAKLYRLGALLLCHRLQFPFGQEDPRADTWSKEVMMELEMAKLVTNRSMRFVTLPFIIAAVEVRDESTRFETLERVDDCVDQYAPFMQKATKTFLSRVWHERDLNLTTRWFDSVHKPCPVLDSINATCFNGQLV